MFDNNIVKHINILEYTKKCIQKFEY